MVQDSFEQALLTAAKNNLSEEDIENLFRPLSEWPEKTIMADRGRDMRRCFVCMCNPGNGTTYRFVAVALTPEELGALGQDGHTEREWMIVFPPGTPFVTNTAVLVKHWTLHPSFFSEKLGMAPVDSIPFALVLHRLGRNLGI
jgi:hypothetical protein